MIRHSDYRPAWWLPGPHSMTVVASLFPRNTHRALEASQRERFELPDGDFVDLDWWGQDAAETAPTVLILHGLEGSSQSGYVQGLLTPLSRQGWRSVVMHFRGCSGEPNRRARAYHSGETEDVRTVMKALRARWADSPLAAVGYSLGGNVLLKYLGEEGPNADIQVAVAVSVPMMLAPCADRMRRGLSQIYGRWLLASLKASLQRKMAAVNVGLSSEVFERIRCIRSFDEHVTAPLHGFNGADDYYAQSSSLPYLSKIQTPTLILHAHDDPFMTHEVIPGEDELSPSVTLELSGAGGHVGFVAGKNPLRPRFWLEERIPAYLQEALSRAS